MKAKSISDLPTLLKKMQPRLNDAKYFFATVDESELMALANSIEFIVCIFREEEGLSVVFKDDITDDIQPLSQSPLSGPYAMITLAVESDLLSVGLMAAVSGALARKKISCNAFSAYHHDHIFVPFEKKDEAIHALETLARP